jgi:hypothetical protein
MGRLSFFEIVFDGCPNGGGMMSKAALIIEGCPTQIKRNLKRNNLLQSTG